MATYFVASGGSNTSPYDTWANAATSLQTALTAASASGDTVVIQYNGVPSGDSSLAADTTYTISSGVRLISASNDGGSAYTPTVMGDANWIGHASSSFAITIAGTGRAYIWGVTLRTGTSATNDNILTNASEGHKVYEECIFRLGTGTSSIIRLNSSTGGSSGYSEYINCKFWLERTQHYLQASSRVRLKGCSLHSSSVSPTTLFNPNSSNAGHLISDGCDWSLATGTIVGSGSVSSSSTLYFVNCKMASSFSWFAAQTVTNFASTELWVLNCANGDTHFAFGYYNGLGSLASTDSIKTSTGAKFDSTNGVSWRLDTTASASLETPFVTPWIDMYHAGTSSISPSIEVVRDGSAVAYDNDELWCEIGYQGTSGQPLGLFSNDEMVLNGTPAAQATGSLGSSDWTGEGGTAWFGKLNTTVVPAEIGMLRARVCFALPSSTVYVDPYIRM